MKGMALQVSERESVCVCVCARMLLSFVAHAARYKTVVGAHNTVYVRLYCICLVWQMTAPTIL